VTPEKGVCLELWVRQLFPTVTASLDDSDITAKVAKISEKAQEVFSWHKGSSFFASDLARFYPRSRGAAFGAR